MEGISGVLNGTKNGKGNEQKWKKKSEKMETEILKKRDRNEKKWKERLEKNGKRD